MTKRKNPKVYTKKGDTGTTQLMYNSAEVSKCDKRVKALADFEMLFSTIALAWQYESRPSLALAMKRLRKLGGELGTHPAKIEDFYNSNKYAAIDNGDVEEVEEWIDELQEKAEIPHAFVFAQCPEAAHIDLARAAARRLETALADLFFDHTLTLHSMRYINRLSDWLFCLARYVDTEFNHGYAEMFRKGKMK